LDGFPKPVIGCGTNVSPGMHVKTESPMVTDSREGIMEFLLVNHPLDCPICDQAGNVAYRNLRLIMVVDTADMWSARM
jgi:NADH dehydrogenase/NADH:ubiquinone oxidoreductase subunit G